MSNQSPEALSLEQVVERFVESEEVLRELESKIQTLSQLEQQTDASAQTLERSASRLIEYVDETRELTEALAEVSQSSRELLNRARGVLDGSQLQRIESLVEEGTGELDAKLSNQSSAIEGIRSSVEELDGDVGETRARLLSELDHTEALAGIQESLAKVTSEGLPAIQSSVTAVESRVRSVGRTVTWLIAAVIGLQGVVLALLLIGSP